jgi:hypothetical protein
VRNGFDPVRRDDVLGTRADAAELAIREKQTKTGHHREERGLVTEVHGPEVAEEADLRGLVFRHTCVGLAGAHRNVAIAAAAIHRRPTSAA